MWDLEKKDDTPDTPAQQTQKEKNEAFEKELAEQDKNADQLDGKAKESAVVSRMAENDISKLGGTVTKPEELKQFKIEADILKNGFDASTAAVLADNKKSSTEKRQELTELYTKFKGEIEKLQGEFVGYKGAQKAREAEQVKQEAKVAKDATEQFHESREKALTEIQKEREATQKELEFKKMSAERKYAVEITKKHFDIEKNLRKAGWDWAWMELA